MMFHPGLPLLWAGAVWTVMAVLLLASLFRGPATNAATWHFDLAARPVIGPVMRRISRSAWLLATLKLAMLAVFLGLIAAGLFGTQFPRYNAATVLTWNIWWTGLVFSILLVGSAWCAVCPWDTLANLLVRHSLLRSAGSAIGLDLRVPRGLRNLWPALALFVGLSWLELGIGVTSSPYETALLALMIVVLAITAATLFERKAFCRFFCPVGRTVGFYSQLAPVELRPQDSSVCATCKSLECYYGSARVDPCPTHQVMGRMTQNTFCTSCGNCARSCPHQNVIWRLRSPSAEAISDARPHWDEAAFMLGLLALATLHGLSMLPFWEGWTRTLASLMGGPGALVPAFTLLFLVAIMVPVAAYSCAIVAMRALGGGQGGFRRDFARYAFMALPLAFSYHLAHNLNHLVREGRGIGQVLTNPFGAGVEEMGSAHMTMMPQLLPQNLVWGIQAALMAVGFVIALRIISARRGRSVGIARDPGAAPLVIFAVAMTVVDLWILMQPMMMRF